MASIQERSAYRGSTSRGEGYAYRGLGRPPPGTRKADGAHPTGMLSFFQNKMMWKIWQCFRFDVSVKIGNGRSIIIAAILIIAVINFILLCDILTKNDR